MNTAIAALCGAVIAIILVALAYAAYSAWKLLCRMEAACDSFTKTLKTTDKTIATLHPVMEGIRAELSYMRQMSEAQIAAQGGALPGGEEPPAPQTPTGPGKTPIYPAPILERFPIVSEEALKDATPADNAIDVITQTDAELADAERKEMLRERGILVEDDEEVHPGIEGGA